MLLVLFVFNMLRLAQLHVSSDIDIKKHKKKNRGNLLDRGLKVKEEAEAACDCVNEVDGSCVCMIDCGLRESGGGEQRLVGRKGKGRRPPLMLVLVSPPSSLSLSLPLCVIS
jgi:hypothetical protein